MISVISAHTLNLIIGDLNLATIKNLTKGSHYVVYTLITWETLQFISFDLYGSVSKYYTFSLCLMIYYKINFFSH